MLGDIILQEMNGTAAPVGTQLQKTNITQHLEQSSIKLESYQVLHPELQTAIQQLIQSAPENIHFPSRQ